MFSGGAETRQVQQLEFRLQDGWSSVLRPRRQSIGYMGDGFYRSKYPTNNIKVLKENLQRKNQTTQRTDGL